MGQARSFINEQVPFARHCGIEVIRLDDSVGEALLPEMSSLANHVGTQHAGALFTVAETASGACMLGLIGPRFARVTPLARTASITFRRPAQGPIRASAASTSAPSQISEQLDQDGRSSFSVSVELTDRDDTLVATAEIEWHLRSRTADRRSGS
jgi:acyl-coenzyme A thioesterase PaaI-like protein